MTTEGEALRGAVAALAAAGIEAAALEARLLLNFALGRPRAAPPEREAPIDPAGFRALLARRLAHEPLALILGRQGFWTLDLAVSGATLIPRADSETLIEAAIAARPERAGVRRILDLGTGTGCLLLAALVEFPAAWGVGVDRVAAAAALAAGNATASGLAARAAFVVADWAAPLVGRFDLVLSNPPYVERAAIGGLMAEVARHEPATALDGGADGLDAYRALLPALPGLLAADGAAVLEIGAGQAGPVGALAGPAGLAIVDLRADLGGIARALVLRRALP